MFGIQPLHLILIILVALIIFGPQRLPEIGRALGKSINEFKAASKEMTDSFNSEVNAPKPAEATVARVEAPVVTTSDNGVAAASEEAKS